MKLFKKTMGVAISLMLMLALIMPMNVWAAGEPVAETKQEEQEPQPKDTGNAEKPEEKPEEKPDISGEEGPGETDNKESNIPNITISVGKDQKTPSYEVGTKVDIFPLNVENQGRKDANNIKVIPIIDNDGSWPFEIANWNEELSIDKLPIGKMGTVKWKDLKVRSDAGTKTYKLAFQIICDDGTNVFEATKYVFVKTTEPKKEEPKEEPKEDPSGGGGGGGEIVNSDPTSSGGGSTDKSSVPRVIVTGFNTDPGVVNAGSDFKLIVHLKNTSTKTAVSNMLFDLQAPASGSEGATEAPAFLPSSGSSTVYLDSIPAGGTKDISIALNARADLVQKPYSITMTMKYEDSKADEFESSSSLAIPVKQAARFEFSELEIAPEAVAVGEEASITCSLYNTGRIKLYNVKVKFQGEGIDAKEVFVGNINSGATGSIDGLVTATAETKPEQKFKMLVSYEDDAGKVSTVDKEFMLQIMPEQAPMDMMGGEAMAIPEEKGFPVLPVAIGAGVLAAIVGAVIVLKKRKKKKESVEEEDLLDEVDRFTEDE